LILFIPTANAKTRRNDRWRARRIIFSPRLLGKGVTPTTR